jgi:curli biogenesis system outer membrane secretion channel CsgG
MRKILLASTLILMSACKTMPNTEIEHISINAPNFADTPISDALRCLDDSSHSELRVGVHLITDKTQKYTPEADGAPLPISGTEMMITALDKAGIKLVNRHQTAVVEWELKMAGKKILGDGEETEIDGKTINYRAISKGGMRGSDYFVTGAFNNLDFNTSSGGAELDVGGIGAGYREYEMLIAGDWQVWNTTTTELYWSRTIAKRLSGEEFKAGVFRFISDDLVDFGAGYESHDPTQWSSRYITEFAAYQLAVSLYGGDSDCAAILPH